MLATRQYTRHFLFRNPRAVRYLSTSLAQVEASCSFSQNGHNNSIV
jgi:fumarate hydratase class II